MFSGLTNQVSSLFSKNAEEQVPTPTATAEDGQAAAAAHPVASSDLGGVENNNGENAEKQRYVELQKKNC